MFWGFFSEIEGIKESSSQNLQFLVTIGLFSLTASTLIVTEFLSPSEKAQIQRWRLEEIVTAATKKYLPEHSFINMCFVTFPIH